MKRFLMLLPLVLSISMVHAQYSKEKLTDILTGGSTKAWSVKSTDAASAEKSYAFNKDLSVLITKADGAIRTETWKLGSADNIRWFIAIGSQKHELIVSYDKAGSQFIKLTRQSGDKGSVYSETLLYPLK